MNHFLIEARLRLPDCDELVHQAVGGTELNLAQVREVLEVLGASDVQQALQIWRATKAKIVSDFERELVPISLTRSDTGL